MMIRISITTYKPLGWTPDQEHDVARDTDDDFILHSPRIDLSRLIIIPFPFTRFKMATIQRENIKAIQTPRSVWSKGHFDSSIIPPLPCPSVPTDSRHLAHLQKVDELSLHAPQRTAPCPEPSLLAALSSLTFSGPSTDPEDETGWDITGAAASGSQPRISDADAEAGMCIEEYHPSMRDIIGNEEEMGVRHALLASDTSNAHNAAAFFHAGCAFVLREDRDEIWCTSTPLVISGQASMGVISKVTLHRPTLHKDDETVQQDGNKVNCAFPLVEWKKLRSPTPLYVPLGAVPFRNGIVYCARGAPGEFASAGLFHMPFGQPPVPMVTGYCGREFNSPWGIAVEESDKKEDNVIWFTDSAAMDDSSADGRRRPGPVLPPQLYRFDVGSSRLRAMADGFSRPRGVAVTADRKTVYVADKSAIYAFDVRHRSSSSRREVDMAGIHLGPRRLFAHVLRGQASGLLCDREGNVFAGCGDGVEIFSAVAGQILGRIKIPGTIGAAVGLAWGRRDGERMEMIVSARRRLWMIFLPAPCSRKVQSETMN